MEGTYYLQIGTILHERYEIKDILGAGGFGITYKAWITRFRQRYV